MKNSILDIHGCFQHLYWYLGREVRRTSGVFVLWYYGIGIMVLYGFILCHAEHGAKVTNTSLKEKTWYVSYIEDANAMLWDQYLPTQ